MRVLFDGRPIRTPISGVARYCIGLANALAKRPELSLSVAVQGTPRGNPHLQQLKAPMLTLVGDRSTSVRKLQNLLREYLPLLEIGFRSANYDIVHETYFADLGNARRIPKIATIHDVLPIDYPDMFLPVNRRYSKRNFYRQVAEAHAIIAVSEYTKQRICALSDFDPDRIHVIGNAFELPPDSGDASIRPEIRSIAERPDGFALAIGNIEPRKNLARLVDAWTDVVRQAGPIQLVIAGKLMNDPADLEATGQAKLGDNFRYIGPVTEAEKWFLIRSMRLMVFPSLLEGFGIPVVEAHAMNKPCVFARATAMTELATGPEQLFDPLSVADMTRCIVNALTAPSRMMEGTALAQRRALGRTWDVIAEQTVRAYTHAMDIA